MSQNNGKENFKGLYKRCTAELAGNMRLIEIHSDYELIISGCRNIVEYDSSNIIIETISGNVKVCGKDLILQMLQGDVLIVDGNICSLFLKDYD